MCITPLTSALVAGASGNRDGAATEPLAPEGGRCSRRDRIVRPRVLFATSELFPLVKTGGLADVSAALPAALADLGVDIAVILPGYPAALEQACGKGKPTALGDVLGLGDTHLINARTPDTGLPLWLVDCPALFRRDGNLYADGDGQDWPDNAMRFALFSHAVTRLALGGAEIEWRPDIVHVNDWHAGLVPALLSAAPAPRPDSVLTIHNLAFQGLFPAEIFPRLGLPDALLGPGGIEFFGQVSFLKAAIRFADRITTVSPTYAREILTPEFGCGLDGLLHERSHDVVGILNGIDRDSWSPRDRDVVPAPFDDSDLRGKRECKAALQRELRLETDPAAPLLAFVSRLEEQKMADVLPEIGPLLDSQEAQLVVCGEGNRSIEASLRAMEGRHPGQVSIRIGYSEPLARRILAGADMLLAPARFEPCGLTQMYAMGYGTIPVARRVGGLADTVRERDKFDRAAGPTGFLFRDATVSDLMSAIRRACGIYRKPFVWRAIQRRAMSCDFGWARSSERYFDLYNELLGEKFAKAAPIGMHDAGDEWLLTGT